LKEAKNEKSPKYAKKSVNENTTGVLHLQLAVPLAGGEPIFLSSPSHQISHNQG
jgi:hypothetical protein